MLPELDPLDSLSFKIKNTRKALGISQKALAKMLGMSQSTIARLESDIERLNPSYRTVYNVVDMLDTTAKQNESSKILAKASKDVMHKDIVYLKADETIEKAVKLIKDYDITELPVLNSNKAIVGSINQKKLLTIATQSPEAVSRTRIREIMDAGLPQVDQNTEIGKIMPVLRNFDAVIIMDGSKAVGIITLYDILKLL